MENNTNQELNKLAKVPIPRMGLKVSNDFLQALSKNTMLGAKTFVKGLSVIEERNGELSTYPEYQELEDITSVDFTRGLVSEFKATSFAKEIKRKTGGTYYENLKELANKSSPNYLPNQFFLFVWDEVRKIYGATEVITATYYDENRGTFLIKWSAENRIKDRLIELKNNFSIIDYSAVMGRFKSIYAYKIFSYLIACIGKEDSLTMTRKEEYEYVISLAQLRFICGTADPNENKDVLNSLKQYNPNFDIIYDKYTDNKILDDWSEFKRNVLAVAKKEISKTEDWEFDYNYKDYKGGKGGRVYAVKLIMRRKKKIGTYQIINNGTTTPESDAKAEQENEEALEKERERITILETIKKLLPDTKAEDGTPFSEAEIRDIADVSEYDIEKVKMAVKVLNNYSKIPSNTMGFLKDAIKGNWKVGETKTNYNKNAFNQIINSDYDFKKIEEQIINENKQKYDEKYGNMTDEELFEGWKEASSSARNKKTDPCKEADKNIGIINEYDAQFEQMSLFDDEEP